jgi:LEA14-like dessication related protein
MRQRLTLILTAILLASALSSCKVYPPVYKRIDNFQMVVLNKEGFKVYGQIVMYNPNRMRCRLNDMLMNIELDKKHVATAGQVEPVRIRARREFAVPLDLTISSDMSFMDGLNSIFKIVTKKEMNVTLNGVVVVQAYGIKVSIPIKQEEKVDLAKLK